MIWMLAGLFWAGLTGFAQDTLDLYPQHPGSLLCWSESRSAPRLIKIYYLKINLADRDLQVTTMPGKDPDGPGPAESTLTPPTDLFQEYHALAAVNANAFSGLPGTENDIRGWYRNRPVGINGMAVADGKVISMEENGRTAFWLDRSSRPHIGNPKPGDSVWQAVSDWSSTLILNNNIVPDTTYRILNPHTALGFDDSGKWLLIVVVDGRQQGYSEGMSLHELAWLFRQHGCTQAINMDGGGSSIMMIQKPGSGMETVNRPSGKMPRPVPLMLGIRRSDR